MVLRVISAFDFSFAAAASGDAKLGQKWLIRVHVITTYNIAGRPCCLSSLGQWTGTCGSTHRERERSEQRESSPEGLRSLNHRRHRWFAIQGGGVAI